MGASQIDSTGAEPSDGGAVDSARKMVEGVAEEVEAQEVGTDKAEATLWGKLLVRWRDLSNMLC